MVGWGRGGGGQINVCVSYVSQAYCGVCVCAGGGWKGGGGGISCESISAVCAAELIKERTVVSKQCQCESIGTQSKRATRSSNLPVGDMDEAPTSSNWAETRSLWSPLTCQSRPAPPECAGQSAPARHLQITV